MFSKVVAAAIVAFASYTAVTAPATNAGLNNVGSGNVSVTITNDWPEPPTGVILEVQTPTEEAGELQ
jgi:hypothetical protein